MNIYEFINAITSGALDMQLAALYGRDERTVLKQRARYLSAAENYSKLYPEFTEIGVFSASGRTEIGGNHTDHQNGRILAAALEVDTIAIASVNEENVINAVSAGFGTTEIDIEDLSARDDEKFTAAALIKGVTAGLADKGHKIGGFNAYITSDIPAGSGISSSAAFEVLIGNVISSLFNNSSISPIEIAEAGKFAENEYFGKKSGLMDQLVSSSGGFVAADLEDPDDPKIKRLDFDFSGAGYSLCITDTKSSHCDLSEEYSAIASEMEHAANELGYASLREADEDEFYEKLPQLRGKCSDRELLRAAHFFAENRRVEEMVEALENGDTEEFFRLVNESGSSSAELLQNLYSIKTPEKQGIPLAIMISRRILGGSGAVRVHGGGFGGTVQAFVPSYMAERYAEKMNKVFGDQACRIFSLRAIGGCEIKI